MIARPGSPGPLQAFASFSSAAAHSREPADPRHPCLDCVAPCCSAVTLLELRPETFRDVDYLQYLLGFARIELCWLPSGAVEVNYRALCTRLNRETGACTVHGTREQPFLCQTFDAHHCSYRAQFLGHPSPASARISASRFPAVASLFRYDRGARIVHRPTLAEVLDAVQAANPAADAIDARLYPETEPWPASGSAPAPSTLDHAALRADPCRSCIAPCCRVLLFPLPAPTDQETVSFITYALGFPGIELSCSPKGWALQCFTRCAHLQDDNRCGLMGQPTRPVYCESYDAWSCRYRATYLDKDPSFLRIDRAAWQSLADLFVLNGEGEVREVPSFETVQRRL